MDKIQVPNIKMYENDSTKAIFLIDSAEYRNHNKKWYYSGKLFNLKKVDDELMGIKMNYPITMKNVPEEFIKPLPEIDKKNNF